MGLRDDIKMKVLEEQKFALEEQLYAEARRLAIEGISSSVLLRRLEYQVIAVDRKLEKFTAKRIAASMQSDSYDKELERRTLAVSACEDEIAALELKVLGCTDAFGKVDIDKLQIYDKLLGVEKKRLGAVRRSLEFWKKRKEMQPRTEKSVVVKEVKTKEQKIKEMPAALQEFLGKAVQPLKQSDPNDFFGASKKYTSTPMDLAMLKAPGVDEFELKPTAEPQEQEDIN